MKYYAHSTENPDKSDWQELKDHLAKTAKKSAKFAEKFNHEEFGRIVGLFHDLGKYSQKFQRRLKGSTEKVDHSTAGAIEVTERYGKLGKYILAHCIAGHHGGLLDTGSGLEEKHLTVRLKKAVEDYTHYNDTNDFDEIDLPKDLQLKLNNISAKEQIPFAVSFLTRMLYSCLVDADWLDTGEFHKKIKGEKFFDNNFESLDTLYKKLLTHLKDFERKTGKINQKRNEILLECLKKAENKKGLYSLTVPTGGGKTLSSLAFALTHAIQDYNKHDRIIYAIPYTSIIEQNAAIFKNIFGEENVLEHHSNYIFEDFDKFEKNEEEQDKDKTEKQIIAEKLKYASENWDAPIIATTNVQFFESLFASKKSRCRKLHNIANSIIILDEAQMIPTEYLIPCAKALDELVNHYNCTVVLCTATQPPLQEYFSTPIQEIMPNPKELFDFFKRVDIQHIGKISDDDLIAEISLLEQVLTIVNTKKHAKDLYERLKEQEGAYHLSTLMCPIHRKQVIEEIKNRLKDENKPTTKVFSTQLIEAGVDIDFPNVYRSSAGLDSIAQSAGRCNREGRLKEGIVKVFESSEKYGMPHGSLKQSAQVGKGSIVEFSEDLLSVKAIEHYFNNLFFYKGKKELGDEYIKNYFYFEDGFIFEFKTAAKKFNFIKNDTYPVIVPFDENAEELIEKLKNAEFPKKYLRQLQPYTVNLYPQDYKALVEKDLVENINDLTSVLRDMLNYDKKTGLFIDKESKAMFV